MIVKKIYLSDIENIERSIKRALALKAFGSKVRPSIAVEIGNDFISISQAKIKYDKTFVHGFTKGDVVNLAIEIDKLHAIGAVHGDLCTSNLALKKDKLYIFDWEPTLELKEGVLRTTSYCVHPSDLKNGFISELTDRYAVLLLAFMVKNKFKSPVVSRKIFNSKIVRVLSLNKDGALKNCVNQLFASS